MSRINRMNEEISWGNEPKSYKSGPHPDYAKNLEKALRFCQIHENGKSPVQVKLRDSEALKNALVMISWNPGNTEKIGQFATPISLHQPTQDFKTKIENIFNVYVKKSTDHEKLNPKQPDMIDGLKA